MKTFFYLTSLLLFTAMSVFVSCGDDDDDPFIQKPNTEVTGNDNQNGGDSNPNDSTATDSTATVVVATVAFTETNTLVVTSNVENAIFKFAGQTKTGNEATFETAAKTGKLEVSATGKLTVTKNVRFASDENYQVFEVTLVSQAPSVAATTAEATGAADVTNGDANAAENDGVTASFNVAGNPNIDPSTAGQDYSVTVFTPAETATAAESLTQGATVSEPVLSLDCQPDGAMFDNPITVKVTVPGANAYEIGCVGENGEEPVYTQTGNELNVQLSHFSVWDIVLKATVVSVTSETISLPDIEGDASTGSLTYTFDYGYETETTHGLIQKYLKKVFGVAKKICSKTVTFTPIPNGTAKMKLSQQVKTYTFKSGNATFTAKVYGKVTVESMSVDVPEGFTPTPPTDSISSGGSVL